MEDKTKRILLYTGAGLGVLFLIILGVLLIPGSYEEEVELNTVNSDIYALLVGAGIEEALVDTTADTIYVSYELPSSLGKEVSWYYVMGAVASVADVDTVVLQAYVDSSATEEVTVSMSDINAVLDGEITEEEFDNRLIIA